MQAIEDRFVSINGAIKYIAHGRSRHVSDVPTLQTYDLQKNPVVDVSADDPRLSNLRIGPFVPPMHNLNEWVEGTPTTFMGMRNLMVSVARGRGIEIGAGPYALQFPLCCDTTYVDLFGMDWQTERMWPGTDPNAVMAVDRKDSFETLETVEDVSVDYIAAAHVIEHLPNPIKAIANAYKRLKPGGYLFLVVPEKRNCFDLHRDPTTLSHLLEDYENPNRARDIEHHREYHRLAACRENWEELAQKSFESGEDIHYHVWTATTFYEMVQHIRHSGIASFRDVWWRSAVPTPPNHEFYFALRK